MLDYTAVSHFFAGAIFATGGAYVLIVIFKTTTGAINLRGILSVTSQGGSLSISRLQFLVIAILSGAFTVGGSVETSDLALLALGGSSGVYLGTKGLLGTLGALMRR